MFSKLKIKKEYTEITHVNILGWMPKFKGEPIVWSKTTYYSLVEPLTYKEHTVWINAMTDLASIPYLLKWAFGSKRKWFPKSAVLHDDLYTKRGLGKLNSDWIYFQAMGDESIEEINKFKTMNKSKTYIVASKIENQLTRGLFFIAVVLGGWISYWRAQ